METNEAKEVAAFICPKCGAPGITLQTAQCPNCNVLFKAAKDIPFDPRAEISADARHIASRIVTHLWILFVLLPVVLGLLWAVFK
jgi:hypothetical protein